MSVFDQLRQRLAQQQSSGGMAAPMQGAAPAGMPAAPGRFDFVPNRPQFQPAPIPPGLSPGAAGQAQFERMPMMQPAMGLPGSGPPPLTRGTDGRLLPNFSGFGKLGDAVVGKARSSPEISQFLQRTDQLRNAGRERLQMLGRMNRPSVGAFDYASLMGTGGPVAGAPFGYGNLDEYVRRMQAPGLGY